MAAPQAGRLRPDVTDDVLYMVYAKTVSLISHNRLTHWHNIDTFRALQEQYDAGDANSPSSFDLWFGLPTPRLDIFLEELATWRNISTYAPQASLQASAERPLDEDIAKQDIYIPSMTLDVILDPARLADRSGLLLVKEHASRSVPVEVLAKQDADEEQEDKGPSQRPLILERWRIDFNAFPPESPPTHDQLYQDCSTLLASLPKFSTSLPAQKLYRRIRAARIRAESQDQTSPEPSFHHLLQMGCRLGAGEPTANDNDDGEQDGDDEIGLRVKLSLSTGSETGEEAEMETSIHGFNPIITPIGSISISVEYRNNVDFYVKASNEVVTGVTAPPGIASIELRPDEDFFKPKQPPAPAQSPIGGSSSVGARKVSALSVLRQQSTVSGTGSPLLAPSAPSSGTSSPGPSVFSTSAPGRPVAGLSSLRTQSSTPIAPTTDMAFASGSSTSTTSASPAAGEPAFITHNRRPSMSERRFRTISGLSFDRASPPSPGAQTTTPIRPALPPQMRFGSYSPSSPSPLAQQLSSSQGQSQRHPYSTSYTGGSGSGALNASRASVVGSPNFSLRSIFQEYGPRAAGARSSISSVGSLSGGRVPSTSYISQRPPVDRKISSEGEGTVSGERSSPIAGASVSSTVGGGSIIASASHESSHDQKPTVSPQMIQRYPRTPSYRQERRMTGGSIGETDADSVSGVSGRNVGSSSTEGGASVGGGSYSRSWQARTEARQAMIANAMQRGSLGSAGSGSPGSLYARGSPPVLGPGSGEQPVRKRGSAQGSSASPASTSSHGINRKHSIDDFVAMIESRPQLNSPRITRRPGPTPAQPVSQPPSSSPQVSIRQGSHDSSSSSGESLAVLRHQLGDGGSPPNSGSGIYSGGSAYPSASRLLLSRSAVDDMLAKMSLSVNRLTAPSNNPSTPPTGASGSARVSTDTASAAPSAPSGATELTIEGGLGARVYYSGTRGAHDSTARSYQSRATLETPKAAGEPAHRRLASRSQSSFELSSPDQPLGHLQHRSSSGYEDGENESGLSATNYDEEEPAGRLELHSEPSTPYPGNGGDRGGYLAADAMAAGRRHGSDGNEGGNADTGAGIRQLDIEGGLGGLGPNPSDAERLRNFGEELGSTRGRRNHSPWGIKRSVTPGSAGVARTSGGGPSAAVAAYNAAAYGAFAMRPSQSHSHSRHLRGVSARGASGGGALSATTASAAVGAGGTAFHRSIRDRQRSGSTSTATAANDDEEGQGDNSTSSEDVVKAASGPPSANTSQFMHRDW